MKKIINGKKYDTATAKEIGSYSYSYPSDFDYFDETLYLKRTGEFFVHGKGGPRSMYGTQQNYNTWSYGENIRPLSVSEAQEWMEQYCTGEEYENVFGEVEE